MILELGDGRELKFPDEMADETARQLKTLILALEERAKIAEAEARISRDEVIALRRQFDATVRESTAVVGAVNALRTSLESGVGRIIAAQLADTVLVTDELGEQNTSRKVLRGV